LPPSRLRTVVPGQQIWVDIAVMLDNLLDANGPAVAQPEVIKLLLSLSKDNFLLLRQSPPLLYHNDLTASVPRFYWSEELGYAIWLRLYLEYERQPLPRVCGGVDDYATTCGAK
jgi:hypothetical protein